MRTSPQAGARKTAAALLATAMKAALAPCLSASLAFAAGRVSTGRDGGIAPVTIARRTQQAALFRNLRGLGARQTGARVLVGIRPTAPSLTPRWASTPGTLAARAGAVGAKRSGGHGRPKRRWARLRRSCQGISVR